MSIEEAKKIKLSKNFTLWEFVDSADALKYGYYYYQLAITDEQINNLRALCINILQPLRDYIGQPITITSGFRSPQLNKKIKGATNSDHLLGMAADFKCHNIEQAFDFITKKCKFRQLINEYDFRWIHISYNEKDNKCQILKLP